MTDWESFRQGMKDARSSGEPAMQATSSEAIAAGGPDFMREAASEKDRDWHRGYDYAVRLARQKGVLR
jgi:hypothetical protein